MAVKRWRAEEPLGFGQIFDGLRMKSGSLAAMRARGKMPDEDGALGQRCPWWYVSTVVEWVFDAGFVPLDTPKTWSAIKDKRLEMERQGLL